MAPSSPPALMDDLIGEILLRLPPEDPRCLVRASVVCNPWSRLLSDPGFPSRYREFHRSPPLLGFFHNKFDEAGLFLPCFMPIKEGSPITNPQTEPDCWIIDCRHGRVLLINIKTCLKLIVWDPVTNIQQNIGEPKLEGSLHSGDVAVLCAVVGCDHLGCHGGPSLLVYVYIDILDEHGATALARVYSTETGTWNDNISSVHLGPTIYGCGKMIRDSVLVEDALYFIVEDGRRILKCDMVLRRLSVMSPPPLAVGNMVLMKSEGGGLGACIGEGHSLNLWAWRTGPGGIWEWEKGRVIMHDIGPLYTKHDVVGLEEGAGSILVKVNNEVFTIELKSGQARKIGKGGDFKYIFPFMSFYTPEIMPLPL